MAQALAFTGTGNKKDTAAKLDPKVFAVEPNHQLLGLAYRSYLANSRGSGAKTLTRGQVRGGGRKPWRQKGTGRARAGSIRLPHWRGGGVAFGPTGEENYSLNLPQKMKRAAIRQSLSLQAQDKKVIIIEAFDGGEGKVKPTLQLLNKLELEGKLLLVVVEITESIDRATRNLAGVEVAAARYLNTFIVLNADWIVITPAAHDQISKWLGSAK